MLRKLAFALAIVTSSSIPLEAQWIPTHGPTGAFISWITADGGTIYVGNYDGTGGVFKTTDNGAHFSQLIAGVGFTSLYASGQNLVAIDRGTPDTAWVSHDGGQSWTKPVVVPNNHYINSIIGDATAILAATDSGVYRSTDEGNTWTPRNAGLNSRVVSLIRSGSTLIAGSSQDGVFFSSDDGLSWQQSNQDKMFTFLNFGNAGPITFAIAGSGVFGSTDHGASWAPYQNGLQDTNGVGLVANGTDAFVATGEYGVYGIYKWNSSSGSWNVMSNPLLSTQITFGQSELISTANESLTFSSDGGSTWRYAPGAMLTACRNIAMIGQSLFADRNGYIYVSTDQGSTWPRQHWNHFNDSVHVIGYVGSSAIGAIGNDILLSDNLYGIRRVTFDGLHATSLLPTNQFFNYAGANGIFGIGDTIFAGASDIYDIQTSSTFSGIYVSTDQGMTWTHRNNGLTDTLVTALSLSGSTIYAGTEFGKLFSSTDDGFNWKYLGSLPGGVDGIYGIAVENSKIVVIGYSTGVYVSFDNGATFSSRSEGLPPGPVYGLTSDSKYFYVSTDSGVWKRTIDDLSGVNATPSDEVTLGTYPNPASASTTIQYSLKNAGTVSLTAIDALGRVVWNAAEHGASAGTHNLELPMSTWPKGCYEVILSRANESKVMTRVLKQ